MAHTFTIGQRKGLDIGGKKEPLFVIQTDVINNILYVGMGEKHPGLFKESLKIKKINATDKARSKIKLEKKTF